MFSSTPFSWEANCIAIKFSFNYLFLGKKLEKCIDKRYSEYYIHSFISEKILVAILLDKYFKKNLLFENLELPFSSTIAIKNSLSVFINKKTLREFFVRVIFCRACKCK